MWLMASRNRVELAQRFFDAAKSTGMVSRGKLLVKESEVSLYSEINIPDNWQIIGTKSDGMGDKFRELFDAYSMDSWVGIVNDDFVPESQVWDVKLVIEALKAPCFVSCADGTGNHKKRQCGATVWNGGLVREVGYLYPKDFNHLYFDDAWEILGKSTGCWKVREDVLVRHLHPFGGGGEVDETHLKSYSDENWAHDKAAFDRWNKYIRPASILKIKNIIEREKNDKATQ